MSQPNLSQLFADLQRHGQLGEFEKALKVSNKILQEVGDDFKAFHCKIVCYIQLGRFDDALTAIHKNSALSGNLPFEKAYCEYRLNRTKEALKTLRSVEDPDQRCQELLGQVLYRIEQYDECFSIYKNLLKNTQDDFEEERETNLSAAMAALQTWGETDIEECDIREDTYELCYNAACFLLGKEMYKESLEKLKKAEELCRISFEDDTEEDIEAELGAIRVQMGYCLQKMKNSSEANKLYNLVLKQKPTDIALTAIASNNIVTINKEQNVFDSKKKMKAATVGGLNQKLVSQQRESIAMNQCLLYMYSNQGDECKRVAQQLQKEYPDNNRPSLIHAAQLSKEKQLSTASEVLREQMDRQGGNSLNLKLTLAQLYLSQGQVYKACEVLRDLNEYTYKPGVVSALVTLYLSQEDATSASEVLNNTVAWYQENDPHSPELVGMIRANANFQLEHGSPHTATEMLEELRRHDPHDLKTLAQLISAYSKFDAKKAQATSKELPSAEELSADVNVDDLESSVAVLGGRTAKKKTAKAMDASPTKPQSPKSGEGLIEKQKKKKKKKGKLPKNYEAGAEVDAERWLPVRERSYFRGKKRKNKKDVGKGTQGAVTQQQMASLDASYKSPAAGSDVGSPRPGSAGSGPASGGASAATGATSQPAGPRKQKPQANKQKKKKKGGKW